MEDLTTIYNLLSGRRLLDFGLDFEYSSPLPNVNDVKGNKCLLPRIMWFGGNLMVMTFLAHLLSFCNRVNWIN